MKKRGWSSVVCRLSFYVRPTTDDRRPTTLAFLIAATLTLASSPASAVSLIRDAEIEHYLRELATPLWQAADLKPENVRIFIVQDSAINAYVAGGQNIFIHTGLLRQMDNPGMLMGVIAHETGHIAGGHIARGAEKLRSANIGMILGYVLGAAAAMGGGGDAGMAVLTGSQQIMQRNMLSFSRANEQAADQAALSILEAVHASAKGMLGTFELLRRQEMKQFGAPNPYAITHPLSKERIEHIRAQMERSRVPEGAYPKELNLPHQRMRAKLYAFLEMPPKTFARYPASDRSVPARIARAVAWYKIPELKRALSEVDLLIAENPKDPFLYDLKGQILFENGKIREALSAYSRAVQLLPDAPLLRSALAEVRIATAEAPELARAVEDLNRATERDNSNASAWRLLATAQGRLGNLGMSHLALAEEAALLLEADTTRREAEEALKALPENSPGRLRAEDLKRLAAEMKSAKAAE